MTFYKISAFAGLALVALAALVSWFNRSPSIRCTFDRNEIGPMGDHGQWYWEIYKCSDGSERRELVAGPRG